MGLQCMLHNTIQADTREELSVKGEQMELVKKLDDSWAEVRIGRSKGLVPLSYIKKLKEVVVEKFHQHRNQVSSTTS